MSKLKECLHFLAVLCMEKPRIYSQQVEMWGYVNTQDLEMTSVTAVLEKLCFSLGRLLNAFICSILKIKKKSSAFPKSQQSELMSCIFA